jgi:hypothetical protein
MPTLTGPTAPIPRVMVPSRLSARTLAALAGRPPTRTLVRSTWDELAELERTGQLPDVLATVRAILIEHQILTRTGRCLACRRGARRGGRRERWRRSFPCEVWFLVNLGLQGLFTSQTPPASKPSAGRHAARSPSL